MNKKIIYWRNICFLVIVLLSQVFLNSIPAKPITYKLDENNSKVGFTVKHKITNDVNGEFLKSIATVDYNSINNKIFNVESIIDVFFF